MNTLYLTFLLLVSTVIQAEGFLPKTLSHENIQYTRCNEFTLRYGFIIKVTDIAWYAPECSQNTLLESANKILRFHYFKDVKANFFKESSEEYFLLNLDNEAQQTALTIPLRSFNSGYSDIKPGEYFQLVHTNDSKLSLYLNDNLLATTDNADLAKKYFNIWFGETPVVKKLKKAFVN